MTGTVCTPRGDVAQVATTLGRRDRVGHWKARWGMRRMRFLVPPGLYAVGSANGDAPVLVSANYKMSFDRLRSALGGLDAWILVLDTKGINVWCAAGKGTFGTDELVRRVEAVGLTGIVTHRRLIVPQLGAPGVAAHEVRKRCGFAVTFGPARAEDIPRFIEAGFNATPEMRRVRFPMRDRVALIPMELVGGLKYIVWIAVGFVLLAGLGEGVYSLGRVWDPGVRHAALLLVTFLLSVSLVPALLPWLPGRAFSAKGAWLGIGLALVLAGCAWWVPGLLENRWALAAWALMIPTLASFLGMNFTGASTYTSLSGVQREMRIALPLQVSGAVVGVGLWLAGRFL
jgi:acetyl-CoA decarbonylase/synthase complex subunit gamma